MKHEWQRLVLIGIVLAATGSASFGESPPNIVLILSDDQAWTDYGFMGHPAIHTPRLDRLAERSLVFERGYVAAPLCRPSLGSMVTGRFPCTHGVTGNDVVLGLQGAEREALDKPLRDRFHELPSFIRLLTDNGYLALQTGKWWEGSWRDGGFTHGMTQGDPNRGGRHGDTGLVIGREGLQPIKNFIDLAQREQKPFFVWYAPFMPHTPHNPPQRLLDKYRTPERPLDVARYYAMCEWFDETCGELLDVLEEKGAADDTAVLYICDNGWAAASTTADFPRDQAFPHYAMRSKASPYENGIRTPIMVAWPDEVRPRRSPHLAHSIDLFPTIAAIAGLDAPTDLPGVNLLDAEAVGEREAVFGSLNASHNITVGDPNDTLQYLWCIEGDWKLLLRYRGRDTSRYRMLHAWDAAPYRLFNLKDDPAEKNDLAAAHPEIVARLRRRIEAWRPVRAAAQTRVINAGDYGLREGVDAAPALRAALAACRDQDATKLVIPPGAYACRPDRIAEKYVEVSNNDNGLRRIVFALEDVHGLEIDGQGARFVMHGRMLPFDVHRCADIVLRNFSIDWHKPFFFQGEVVAVHPEENAFDLRVFEECDYEIVADELIFLEKPGRAVRPWKQWAQPVRRDFGWEQSIDWNIWFDPATKAPAYRYTPALLRSYNEKLKKRYRAAEVAPQVVRIHDAAATLPQVGWVLVVKGRKESNRVAPAIHVSQSRDVRVENVDVHHAGGMGFIAERSENVHLEDFNVVLPPDSGRMVTTTADATHFVDCRGLVTLNNCRFENMLDDAANFHGIYVEVVEAVDSHTLGVNRMHGQQVGFDFARPGDKVRLSTSKIMRPYATLEVAAVREINEEYMEIRFVEPVADVLRPDSVADNVSWEADVRMTNCQVRRNRARSILISSGGDVLLEGNTFENCDWVALLFAGDARFWYESGPVRNVVIRDNRFKDLGVAVGGGPVLHFAPRLAYDEEADDHYYHRNIVFENNTCEVIDRNLANLFSVENFVFRGNAIRVSDSYPMSDENKPSFSVRRCRNVRIENNDFQLPEPATLKADEHSADIVIDGNRGFSR